ncbi:MAG TPA: ATP-binding cassette domain-containing protein, partial [Clostridiales bacterium]|nr:ATP-binding cassette domain-containing protein [Clostridiales bacterium]
MAVILECKNLSHTYSAKTPFEFEALDQINLAIEEGSCVGLMGHTGSGKSTLIRHFNGLLKPTGGQVLFEGRDIWEKPKEIRRIRFSVGIVFQYPEYQLFEETVYKDIAFGPSNMGISGEELDRRVRKATEQVGLDES